MHSIASARMTNVVRRSWWRISAAFVVGLSILTAFWATIGQRGDDAHITFVYSRNLADGLGFVFNPGDRTLSTTTPLMAMLMAVPSGMGLDVPSVGLLLSLVATANVAALIYINLRVIAGPAGALATLPVAVMQPFFLSTATNEMLPYIALTLWSLHSLARGRYVIAVILAVLSALMRPDGGLVVAMVASAIAWNAVVGCRSGDGAGTTADCIWERVRGPALALVVTAGPWILFSTWYFGSPVPVTLEAKRAQRELGLGRTFSQLFVEKTRMFLDQPRLNVVAVLVAMGVLVTLVSLARRFPFRGDDTSGQTRASIGVEHRTITYFVGWNVLYVVAFLSLGVSAYGWYIAPLGVSITIFVGVAVGWIVDSIGARVHSPAAPLIATAVLVASVASPLMAVASEVRSRPADRTALYPEVGRWISLNVPPSASVGTLEVGLIGYFAHREIIDFAGLLQPEVIVDAPARDGYAGAALLAWDRFDPEFVAMIAPGFSTLLNDERFRAECAIVQSFERVDVSESMDVWDCR
jgi:hypothetical protein